MTPVAPASCTPAPVRKSLCITRYFAVTSTPIPTANGAARAETTITAAKTITATIARIRGLLRKLNIVIDDPLSRISEGRGRLGFERRAGAKPYQQNDENTGVRYAISTLELLTAGTVRGG